MKKYKLTIKPAIEPESRHSVEDALKNMGYNVYGGGSYVDGSSCDISFSRMEDWQKRVRDEKNELMERVNKLEVFMATQVYADLKPQDQMLLNKQLSIMLSYRRVLIDRIMSF